MTKAQGIITALCGAGALLTFTLTLTLSLPHAEDDGIIWRGAGWIVVLLLAIAVAATAIISQIQRNRVVYVHSRNEGLGARLGAVEDVLAGMASQFDEHPHAEQADVDAPGVVDMETMRNLKNIEDKLRRRPE